MVSHASQLRTERAELLNYVGRRLRDPVQSEDIVQEAYVRLLAFEAGPENAVANAPALLRRISLNLLRDHFRRANRLLTVELSDMLPCHRPSVDQRLEQRQLIEHVAAALGAMPPLRRDVFVRRRLFGESPSEIGEALGLSPSAISNHVARAIFDLDLAIEKLERRGDPVRP